MKPWKQSNSMKELLKKLRRHDTLVLGTGVVAATLMCGAFVYVTTPAISVDAAQQEVRKDSLGVQKKASDQLTEINNYLEKLDEVVTGSQELVKEIQTVQNEQIKNNEKTLEKNNSKETNTKTENTKVVEKISGLDKELASIHSEIKTTTDQVKALKDIMDKGGNKSTDKDKENFAQINNALSDIKKECEKSGTAVSSLVSQMKTDNSENSKDNTTIISNLEKIEHDLQKSDTGNTLTRMETELLNTQTVYTSLMNSLEKGMEKGISNVDKNVDNVEKKVSSGFSKVDKNVGNVEEKVNTGFANVDKNVDKVGKSVETGLSEIDNNVNAVNEQISSGFSNALDGVKTLHDTQTETNNKINEVGNRITGVENSISGVSEQIGTLSKKVDDFFKYVTRAKEEMASTLVTLGVNLKKDASFEEITNGIKQLPAVVMESGQVEYTRHHHKNANGAHPYETSPVQGGCFQTPIYHSHSTGCYKEIPVYSYITDVVTKKHGDISGGMYYCSECGRSYLEKLHKETTTDYQKAMARGKYSGLTTTYKYELVCNKKAGDVDGYAPNCGYKENAIEKAVIYYNKDFTVKTISMATAIEESYVPEETEIYVESIDNNEGEESISPVEEETTEEPQAEEPVTAEDTAENNQDQSDNGSSSTADPQENSQNASTGSGDNSSDKENNIQNESEQVDNNETSEQSDASKTGAVSDNAEVLNNEIAVENQDEGLNSQLENQSENVPLPENLKAPQSNDETANSSR